MDELEPLLTVAEVAVAFAGFASIVTVIAQRGVESWDEGNILRFRLMIYMSLSSILFALLPFAFLSFESLRGYAWSACSLLLGLYLGCYLLAIVSESIRLARQGQLNPFVVGSVFLVVLGVITLQMLASAGFVRASLGSYFVGVLCLLMLAAVSFARLIAIAILPRD